MKRLLITLASLALLPTALALAQSSGGEFEMPRTVVAAGGGSSAGGGFELSGTIGQALAAPASSGGGMTLRPGFWTAGEAPALTEAIFSDGFESED
ncbi:MAG TPA: hypothetical protein PKZ76_14210 [Xanthomonadaceae bacterium]|nr:hypothetical protein [Xanthomonadaceae bacterium]